MREFDRLGFLDINWKDYSFQCHVAAARACQPLVTVARDIEHASQVERVIDQAYELLDYAEQVVVVPKCTRLKSKLDEAIPTEFLLGYSVPTKYGGTRIPPRYFDRPVHLLGGRPDVQRELAKQMQVVSFDCNRFTLDAAFGDYFDGSRFKPHPEGGYDRCLRESLRNINRIWKSYKGRRGDE